MAVATGLSISSPTVAADPLLLPVNLGTAVTYGVLSGASVANTVSAPGAPHTIVRGDVGVSSAGAISGFEPVGPGVVTGIIHANDAAATQAMVDLTAAYDEAKDRPMTAPLQADLAGAVFTPGVYLSVGAVGSAALGIVTLTGPAEAVFIFQVNGALAMGANTQVVLTGGAQASNVFWQVNGAASTGAGSTFVGTIMATTTVGLGAGTLVNGRALALGGAITLDNNSIYSTPAFVTIAGGANQVVTDSDVTIAGTSNADVGTPVAVTFDGAAQLPSPLVGTLGFWSLHVGLRLDGVYPVTASVTDGGGNVGGATQSLVIDTVDPVVVIAGGATATTNDVTPTITGTSDTGQYSVVSLDIDGQIYGALVQSGGVWNFTTNLVSGPTSSPPRSPTRRETRAPPARSSASTSRRRPSRSTSARRAVQLGGADDGGHLRHRDRIDGHRHRRRTDVAGDRRRRSGVGGDGGTTCRRRVPRRSLRHRSGRQHRHCQPDPHD